MPRDRYIGDCKHVRFNGEFRRPRDPSRTVNLDSNDNSPALNRNGKKKKGQKDK